MVKNYIERLNIEDLDSLARRYDIVLSDGELNFAYRFIKRNYEAVYANPNIDLSKFKSHFSEENYVKICELISKLKEKYGLS